MSTPPSIEQIKAGMRSTWMAGDFGVVAKTLAMAGAEDFIARLELPPGPCQALDVATGTGNLAIPLARRLAEGDGGSVIGLDIAPNLLDQARLRADEAGLSITFVEGDAEQLPYPDASFDLVVTMFGAMFAPRPEVVAAELGRVLKPGGQLAMANWNPAGFSGRMFKVGSTHVPPPPGVPPPSLWGDELTVRNRLSPFFVNIQTQLIPLNFDLPFSPAGTVDFFRQYFGPTQMAFARLDDAGRAAMQADLIDLWTGANVAADPTTHTLVHNEYLQVIATRTH